MLNAHSGSTLQTSTNLTPVLIVKERYQQQYPGLEIVENTFDYVEVLIISGIKKNL